jgi:hypothetical protein
VIAGVGVAREPLEIRGGTGDPKRREVMIRDHY